MHSSSMIPFIAGVESDVPSLAECLEECAVFKDGHLELLNELTREMAVWEKDEKARFGAALMWDHPDTIETVMDVTKLRISSRYKRTDTSACEDRRGSIPCNVAGRQ